MKRAILEGRTMTATLTHPLAAGTKVMVERRNAMVRESVVRCEGQLGAARVWWYVMDSGKRASEYQICGESRR